MKKTKVLVVGGGLGGLATAAFLERDGHEVTVVEKRDRQVNSGYAIGLWHNGAQILEKLGLSKRLDKVGQISQSHSITNTQGVLLDRLNLTDLNKKMGAAVRFVPRSELIEALTGCVKDSQIIYRCKIEEIETHTQNVNVLFSDGKKESYDMVVGADGARSYVRKNLFPNYKIAYPGAAYWAFWFRYPETQLLKGSIEMIGKAKMVGFYPTGGNNCGIFACTKREPGRIDSPEICVSKLKEHFAEFGGLMDEALLQLNQPERIYQGDFQDIDVPKWHSGRIVLIGDAAHTLLPTTGQGASLALEDAYVLASLLRERHSFAEAFTEYEQIRRPRVKQVQKHSQLLLKALLIKTGWLCTLRDWCIQWRPKGPRLKALETLLQKRHLVEA